MEMKAGALREPVPAERRLMGVAVIHDNVCFQSRGPSIASLTLISIPVFLFRFLRESSLNTSMQQTLRRGRSLASLAQVYLTVARSSDYRTAWFAEPAEIVVVLSATTNRLARHQERDAGIYFHRGLNSAR
jgi:hypothetical protein